MALNTEKINRFFNHLGAKIIRFRWILLILFSLVVGFSVSGLKKLQFDSSNDAWYFKDDEIVINEERMEKIFGNSDIAAIHLMSDTVMTKGNLETILKLTNELKRKVPYADDVTSLTNLEYIKGSEWGIDIDELVPRDIPEDRASLNTLFNEALSNHSIGERLISSDGKETFIIIDFKTFPNNWNSDENYKNYINGLAQKYPNIYSSVKNPALMSPDQLTGKIVNKIARQAKYVSLNPRTTGVYPMTCDKRAFFQQETPRLMKIGLLLSIIVLAISLRSVRGVIFPVITAIGGMIITLGIEGHLGVTTQPSLIPFPLFLGLAVSVGYSIHVFNFFKKEMNKSGKRKESVIYAIGKTGWPLLFTALTTICALLSFVFLNIKTMTWIGYTTAIIIAVTYILSLVIFPIFLSIGKDAKKIVIKEKNSEGFLSEKLAFMSRWTMKHPVIILVIYTIFAIISIRGLLMARVDFSSERTMGMKVPYVNRVVSVGKSKIGSLNNYSVCLEFPEKNIAKSPETLEKLSLFIAEIEKFELTKRTTSMLDQLKEINKVLNNDDDEYYAIPTTRPMIAQSLLLYENAGGDQLDKWVNYSYNKLRIRVEISEYKQAILLDEHKRIQELSMRYFPEAELSVVGSIAKFCDMSTKVAVGQVKAFSYSILIIAILMMIVFGSFKIGLIGIIPNISPALAVGGVMGYYNVPLDMIMSTLMPMLLGLAVDDTIHFINHAQDEFKYTNNYNIAVERTFMTVGKSLVITSLVMVFNFSVYTSSVANLYFNFGILAGVGIMAALIADLFVTPVCLKLSHALGKEQ